MRLVASTPRNEPFPCYVALDALQLAVALDVRQQHGLDYFVAADKNLCAVAEAEQLSVINPAL